MIINLLTIESKETLLKRLDELGLQPDVEISGKFARVILTEEDELFLTLTYGERFHLKDLI